MSASPEAGHFFKSRLKYWWGRHKTTGNSPETSCRRVCWTARMRGWIQANILLHLYVSIKCNTSPVGVLARGFNYGFPGKNLNNHLRGFSVVPVVSIFPYHYCHQCSISRWSPFPCQCALSYRLYAIFLHGVPLSFREMAKASPGTH